MVELYSMKDNYNGASDFIPKKCFQGMRCFLTSDTGKNVLNVYFFCGANSCKGNSFDQDNSREEWITCSLLQCCCCEQICHPHDCISVKKGTDDNSCIPHIVCSLSLTLSCMILLHLIETQLNLGHKVCIRQHQTKP